MTIHVPILVEPILSHLLEPFRNLPENSEPHWWVDCTFGGGGHTEAVLSVFRKDPKLQKHRVLAVDQDPHAIERGKTRFSEDVASGRLHFHQGRFGALEERLQGIPVLALLADLGFSSDQLEDADRGLSFLRDGPLDMRLNPLEGESCFDLLNSISEIDLERLLREWGEERFSRRIARFIIDARLEGKLPNTTLGLADLIVQAVPGKFRHGRIHAATRSFQALRIAVNRELEELDALLSRVILCIKPGGRVAIMSFHSLEDRRVKHRFQRVSDFKPVHKKAIQADAEEVKRNPRSRSAKLRIAERLP